MEMDNWERDIMPEKILNTMVCQKCYSYLTVLPVLILPNGHHVCGRCLDKSYPEQNPKPFCILGERFGQYDDCNIPMALLSYIHSRTLFPCINKFEGCTEKLQFKDIESHEQRCVFKQIQCSLCNFFGVGTQLINHFRHVHRRYYSEKANLILRSKNNFSETFLYRVANNLFTVKIKFYVDIKQILLDMICLTTSHCFGVIRMTLSAQCGGNKEFTQIDLLSDRIVVSKGKRYVISFKLEDFHFLDVKNIDCTFQLLNV